MLTTDVPNRDGRRGLHDPSVPHEVPSPAGSDHSAGGSNMLPRMAVSAKLQGPTHTFPLQGSNIHRPKRSPDLVEEGAPHNESVVAQRRCIHQRLQRPEP